MQNRGPFMDGSVGGPMGDPFGPPPPPGLMGHDPLSYHPHARAHAAAAAAAAHHAHHISPPNSMARLSDSEFSDVDEMGLPKGHSGLDFYPTGRR